MKRLFFVWLMIAALMPLYADSYHDALAAYLNNSDVSSSKQQFEDKLRPLIEQAIPDNPSEANILLKRYVSTQLMTDMVDIFEPAFRKHVSAEELQELARIYSDPRYVEMQNRVMKALAGFDQSVEYKNLINSMGPAVADIVAGKQPTPLGKSANVPDEYQELFERYYKASKTDELVDKAFAGIGDVLIPQLHKGGVKNPEQVVSQLTNYVSASMPAIMSQVFHRVLSQSDLQMLMDATYSPAYQHTVDAMAEIVADPLGLSAQLLTKMGAWVDINARRYSKSFQPLIQSLNEAANPYFGEIYMAVDKQPEYPDGLKELFHYIALNINVSPEIAERGFSGKTVTRFVVNKNGALSDFEVLRSCGDSTLDAEALRVLSTLKPWTPAILKEEVVRAYFTLPVTFNILPTPKDSLLNSPSSAADSAPEQSASE